ncbi:hypothetical protein [Billgrantia gudaonensis]|uniref:Uncharacterized protein n=1 Tax=Billgrantia gudaonensis TaxID=376427 RepID=A0A1G8XIM0_9GAMM|nr:hypothetical protein [Halomonas gudaonensis]SDJ89610.1 hypothetical protein SAMN04487954_10932 [Halomonas gudaonensis]
MTQPQEQEAPRGGRLARQAAMLCQDAAFRIYLDRRKRYKLGMTETALPDGTHSEQDARDWLCSACGIESRAELDHNPQAAATFRAIQQRFGRWRYRTQRQPA